MKTTRIVANAVATLASLVAFGALVPSTAAAQNACYVPGSGTVYRIKEPNTPAQCSAGHVEFPLNPAAKPGSGGPSGAAGGDLGGSYPNPSVVKIQGQPISTSVPSAGQVLTFSGGAWTPSAPAGGGSLPTGASGAYDFSNINGLYSSGSESVGNFPIGGAGTRMVWFPGHAAFRVGKVTGTQWDNGNFGYRSVGMGLDVQATGDQSMAFGYATKANGTASTAMGSLTVASGVYATAMGAGSQATAGSATAMGSATIASGGNATSMGSQTTASGLTSLAAGFKSTASADYSTAIGRNTVATGFGAIALGENTTASGINSIALGKGANTSGMTGTFVYGDASTAASVGAPLDNSFIVRAQHFWFGTSSAPTAPTGHLIETSTGAYLSTGGTWTNTSDASKKHGFKSVDGEDLLARIDSLPVSTWTYNTESDSVRHMGPTAQDFRKAFGLGDTEKAIATIDADGVSLAAVKALVQRTTHLRKENDDLRALVSQLAQRLHQLEQARR